MKYIPKLVFLGLALGLTLGAQPPADWRVNVSNYQYTMTATAAISINGVESADTQNVIAAFVADECRGVMQAMKIGTRAVFFLMIYSNNPGESVRFKLYLAEHDTVLDCINTLTFEADAGYGDLENPFGLLTVFSAIPRIKVSQPSQFQIEQNFPNPFNGTTRINFSLSKRTAIKLVVFDLAGHQVAQLIAATMDPGRYYYLWHPSSDLPSGFYLFRLSTPDESDEKCGLLLK